MRESLKHSNNLCSLMSAVYTSICIFFAMCVSGVSGTQHQMPQAIDGGLTGHLTTASCGHTVHRIIIFSHLASLPISTLLSRQKLVKVKSSKIFFQHKIQKMRSDDISEDTHVHTQREKINIYYSAELDLADRLCVRVKQYECYRESINSVLASKESRRLSVHAKL